MKNSSHAACSAWVGWLGLVIATSAFSLPGMAANKPPPPAPVRSLKICVAGEADPEIQRAAQTVLAAVATQPLLQAMAKENAPHGLTDTKSLANGKPEERAYSHLVVIGLPDDPLIRLLWQREARIENGGLYIFGWGHLRGDLGYVESARNPFLHSEEIPSVPFETEVVTLTGTTLEGIAAAVRSFLKTGMFNGVVAGPHWMRGQGNLLDRDPVQPDTVLPTWVPSTIGTMKRIGTLAGSEDEYRGVLADSGVEPQEVWRVKYLGNDDWDCGADYKSKAAALFEAGLHRRASGNTLWIARFTSSQEAGICLHKIAAGAKFQGIGAVWYGERPGFSKGPSFGPVALWQRGDWLLMSTLPAAETSVLSATLHD